MLQDLSGTLCYSYIYITCLIHLILKSAYTDACNRGVIFLETNLNTMHKLRMCRLQLEFSSSDKSFQIMLVI